VNGSREPRNPSAAQLPRWLGHPLSLLLALSLLVLPGGTGSSEALGLPGRNPQPINGQSTPLERSSPGGLQEVAPPLAVQQLQEALAQRQPRVEILAPANETLLPPGPWTLRLRVQDWPLVDGGPLGLGPHLVVQVDNEEPLPLTSTERTMPPLAPGSHRLTVFAARPWGEAAKNPGAWCQIRLHRTAANPPELPEPGLAQLIPVSPAATAAGEPLLLDWLLLDAPLQNLRGDDARWRLRVSINGEDLVLDRQTPLWLKGWKPGRNAIRFELLDGRGEPLNPPYNSLVRELELNPGTPLASWQRGPLSPAELAILLGEAAAPPPLGARINPGAEPEPASHPAPAPAVSATEAAPTAGSKAATAVPGSGSERTERLSNPDQPAAPEPGSSPASPEQSSAPDRPSPAYGSLKLPSEPSKAETAAPTGLPAAQRPGQLGLEGSTPLDLDEPPQGSVPRSAPAGNNAQGSSAAPPPLIQETAARAAEADPASLAAPQPVATPTIASPQLVSPAASSAPGPGPEASSPPSPWPGTISPADGRLRPSSSLESSARDQVNEDGTMVRPPRRGPLAGLQERLLP
jgi:hypothetical protein